MAKKILTPEEYKAALDKKVEKRTRFFKTFRTALAYLLACVIVFSVFVIAFAPKGGVATTAAPEKEGDEVVTMDEKEVHADVSVNQEELVVEEGSLDTAEKQLEYFNNVINNVKPSAKKITLLKEVNSKAGSVSGLPSMLNSMADSLIDSNMGEKDISSVAPATTVEAKNAMFPVENETWASKITMEDVESIDFKDNGSTYEITVKVKADAPSTDSGHGNGHNGKIFSVISPSIVTDNAGPAASVISEVKTGHKDGKVTITVDKATGNVTSATYYFVWSLGVKAMGASVTISFGLEKQFKIEW